MEKDESDQSTQAVQPPGDNSDVPVRNEGGNPTIDHPESKSVYIAIDEDGADLTNDHPKEPNDSAESDADDANLTAHHPEDTSVSIAIDDDNAAAVHPEDTSIEHSEPSQKDFKASCFGVLSEMKKKIKEHLKPTAIVSIKPIISEALKHIPQYMPTENALPSSVITELVEYGLAAIAAELCISIVEKSPGIVQAAKVKLLSIGTWMSHKPGCLEIVIKISGDQQIAELFRQLTSVSAALNKVVATETLTKIQPALEEIAKEHPEATKIVSRVFLTVVSKIICVRIFCNIHDICNALTGEKELTLTMVASAKRASSLAHEDAQTVMERFESYPKTLNVLQQLLSMPKPETFFAPPQLPMTGDAGQEKMEPILYLNDPNRKFAFELAFPLLEQTIKDERFKNIPFFVVSLMGSKGIGKSLLTRLLVSKFRFQEEHQQGEPAWINSDAIVDGVKWREDGIVWSRPFVLTTKDEKKVAVILMDCQGFHNPLPNLNEEFLVSLYSLELSKLQVFSCKQDFKPTDLDNSKKNFEEFKSYGLGHLFNTLVMLRRDWDDTEDCGSKGNYFENLKKEEERTLEPTEETIDEAYKKTLDYRLPIPGDDINSGDVTEDKLLKDFKKNAESAKFVKHVDKFGDWILNNYATEPQFLSSQLQLRIALERLTEFSHHWRYDKFPEALRARQRVRLFEEVEDAVLPLIAEKARAAPDEEWRTYITNVVEYLDEPEHGLRCKPRLWKKVMERLATFKDLIGLNSEQVFAGNPKQSPMQKFLESHLIKRIEAGDLYLSLACKAALSPREENKEQATRAKGVTADLLSEFSGNMDKLPIDQVIKRYREIMIQ